MRSVPSASLRALGALAALVLACGSKGGLPSGNDDASAGGDAAREPATGVDSAGTDGAGGAGGGGAADARPSDRFGNDGLSFEVQPTDAAPPSPGKVTCGSGACLAGVETCCVDLMGGGSGTCVPAGQPCLGAGLACDEAADCGQQQVCCANTAMGGGSMPGASCMAESSCTGPDVAVLCRTDGDCPDAATQCCSYGALGMTVSVCLLSC